MTHRTNKVAPAAHSAGGLNPLALTPTHTLASIPSSGLAITKVTPGSSQIPPGQPLHNPAHHAAFHGAALAAIPGAVPSHLTAQLLVPQVRQRRKKKKKTKCQRLSARLLRKIWTLVFLSAAVTAVYFNYYVNDQFYNPEKFGYGFPATENASKASINFKYSWVGIVAMSLVGFFIIHVELVEINIGILYMFGLTLCIYFSCSSLSHAVYASQKDDFTDVFKFMRSTYNSTAPRNRLPEFINLYQQKHKCCGWSVFFTRVWSQEFLGDKFFPDNDIPDSCCVHQSPGCGKSIITEKPSGFISPLLFEPKSPDPNKPPRRIEYCHEQLIARKQPYPYPNPYFKETVPDEFLRQLDLQYYLESNFTIPRICLISKNAGESGRLVYYSYGAEELRRLTGVIFTSPCDVENTTNTNDTTSSTILTAAESNRTEFELQFEKFPMYEKYKHVTREITKVLIIPTAVLSGQCFLMAFIFMYYFSKMSHERTKKLAHPREFTDYDIEGKVDGAKDEDDEGADDDEGEEDEALKAMNIELQRIQMENLKALRKRKSEQAKFERLKQQHFERREEERAERAEKRRQRERRRKNRDEREHHSEDGKRKVKFEEAGTSSKSHDKDKGKEHRHKSDKKKGNK